MLPPWFGDTTMFHKLLDGAYFEYSEWDQGSKEDDSNEVHVRVTSWLGKEWTGSEIQGQSRGRPMAL